jgi:hypothetical protein
MLSLRRSRHVLEATWEVSTLHYIMRAVEIEMRKHTNESILGARVQRRTHARRVVAPKQALNDQHAPPKRHRVNFRLTRRALGVRFVVVSMHRLTAPPRLRSLGIRAVRYQSRLLPWLVILFTILLMRLLRGKTLRRAGRDGVFVIAER